MGRGADKTAREILEAYEIKKEGEQNCSAIGFGAERTPWATSPRSRPPAALVAPPPAQRPAMTTSTTEVNVTTTTLTRATSKAELVDENPDLAAECIQHGAELKVIEPQSMAQPMLSNYEPMLTKVCTTGRTGQLLPGGPADRQFDRDESSSVTMDVRKALDEENIDNDKVYQHKLEGSEMRKLAESQALKEALQETNAYDGAYMQKMLAKGQVIKKRNLMETAVAKRVQTRRENEATKTSSSGSTLKRNVEEVGNAEESVEKAEKQQENIEKVACVNKQAC
ncbi:hypothetical protein HPB47_012311 [Ixodes persulcatus]|uniref:Uncharacterized protein n=1 Tax=Ixodes persulcatus TaxID=34615 RepID=A0AC60NU19_IXOPE|nr:hypothetical protein HPB47_012311 [Ixodes persulcatus]